MRSFILAALFLASPASAGYSPWSGGGGRRQLELTETECNTAAVFQCWASYDAAAICVEGEDGPYCAKADGVTESPEMCTVEKCDDKDTDPSDGQDTCMGAICDSCICVKQDLFLGTDNSGPGSFLPYPGGSLNEYDSELECLCRECVLDPCGTAACVADYCDPVNIVGDPHIKSWAGEWFDYMGQCDLKLISSTDIDIDVRTTIRYDYSFVEAAAIKIGGEVLEVAGFGDYALNGVDGALGPNGHSVPTLGGNPIYYRQVDDKKHHFDIVLAAGKNITVTTFKDWVGVSILDNNHAVFKEVSGLMGNSKGQLLSPTGEDLSEDINAFGQSWQIQGESLFRTVRAPQAPATCILPGATASVTRRLGETVAKSAAEEACAGHSGQTFKFCVHDVMASGDIAMAANAF